MAAGGQSDMINTTSFDTVSHDESMVPLKKHLLDMPTEIQEKIAGNLSAVDLGSFRLASRATAEVANRTLRDSIPEVIEYDEDKHRNPAMFPDHLVVGLQDGFPESAAKVTELKVRSQWFPPDMLNTPAIDAINLPGLRSLELHGHHIRETQLIGLLRRQRRTLTSLTIANAGVAGRKMDDDRARRQWSRVLRFIGNRMQLKQLTINGLFWYAFDGEAWGVLRTPKIKYHRRYLEYRRSYTVHHYVHHEDVKEGRYFHIHNGGVAAFDEQEEAMRLGVRRLEKEINAVDAIED